MARVGPAHDQDVRVCRAILKQGSKSFALASRLLPPRLREPTTVFYAFCRVADDAVDLSPDPARGIDHLHERVARLHAGTPIDDPVDRALARVVERHRLPRGLFDALLEGFRWDAQQREYADLDALLAYCARVASSVGVVMTLLMGRRDRHVLARACDLGAAMQLTNVARDVGEDASRGRLYLPRTWMQDAGVAPETWLEAPTFTPAVGSVVKRLLAHADALYGRARPGIAALPPDCRTSIMAAALIYADIGRVIRRRHHDSVSARAHVGTLRKLVRVVEARLTRPSPAGPLHAPAMAEAEFLLQAVESA
jgi:15-cis-phytoene synthase